MRISEKIKIRIALVKYLNVSDLPRLLHLVVLAVHSAGDPNHVIKSRQVGYPRKGLLMNNKIPQSVGTIALKRAPAESLDHSKVDFWPKIRVR